MAGPRPPRPLGAPAGLMLAIFAIFAVFVAPAISRRVGDVNGLGIALGALAARWSRWASCTPRSPPLSWLWSSPDTLLGIVNTLMTQLVMESAPVARPVVSAAYGFVRFCGGAIAPFVAARRRAEPAGRRARAPGREPDRWRWRGVPEHPRRRGRLAARRPGAERGDRHRARLAREADDHHGRRRAAHRDDDGARGRRGGRPRAALLREADRIVRAAADRVPDDISVTTILTEDPIRSAIISPHPRGQPRPRRHGLARTRHRELRRPRAASATTCCTTARCRC